MVAPKLRFKEFNEEWNKIKFKDICTVNQGLQISIADRFLEDGKNRMFYITNEFLKENSNVKYYIENPPKSVICDRDDLLMTRTGNTGKVVTNVKGAFHNNFFRINYEKSRNDKMFLYYILTSNKIQKNIMKLAGNSTIPDLNHSDFYNIKINEPILEEQEKIAKFLLTVDKRIKSQENIITHLDNTKKGLMQKIFSQEIRFKNDNGEEFSEWEEKRLEECLKYEQPTKYIVSSTEYDNKFETPVLTANKGFLLGYTDDINGIYNKGPVIIFDDFTMDMKYVTFDFKVKSSAIKMLTTINENNLKFMYEYLKSLELKPESHKRNYISEVQPLYCLIPSIKEQEKIANFLSKMDEKIESEKRILEYWKNIKKGLLQQMFV